MPDERTAVEEPALQEVERAALEGLQAEEGHLEADLEVADAELSEEDLKTDAQRLRQAVAALTPAVAAGFMVGGLFTGISPRIDGILTVLLGGLLALGAQRIRNQWLTAISAFAGLFAIGLLPVLIESGTDGLFHLQPLVLTALKEHALVRPPIESTGGFAAMEGWILGTIGFTAVWVAIVIGYPSIGMLVPLLVAGLAAISVPSDEKLIDGILVVVFFGIGLGILSGARDVDSEGNALPLGYELRRGVKALPVLAALAAALFILVNTGLAKFLFPPQIINPALQAQRPKTEPLSNAPNRDLFDVRSAVSGPWEMGVLDVYDGNAWLLPAYLDSSIKEVPQSGTVDSSYQPSLQAEITVRGLGGAVLPGLPNTTDILASGPKLGYDSTSGNIRLIEGEFKDGFVYKIAAAGIPSVQDLAATKSWPASYEKYTYMPEGPPPAVKNLISEAPKDSKWAEWDWLRQWVLHNITASGLGTPVDFSISQINSILSGSKEASPFEMVAMQAMLARWIGLPARIGYGFDGGTKANGVLEVYPTNGAVFPEVFFPHYGWLPVIGQPAHAKADLTANPKFQQFVSGVQPSNDIAVFIFEPYVLPPDSLALEQIRNFVFLAIGVVLLLAILYALYPVAAKAMDRGRRRREARRLGARARIVQAYSEWRDTLTDFGYRHPSDTPIMLLSRFPDDEEHEELAWLVTRALWGDLQNGVKPTQGPASPAELAGDAEELARTMRRRLGQAHPITVRAVAAMSRLSLRQPYVAEADLRPAATEVAHVA